MVIVGAVVGAFVGNAIATIFVGSYWKIKGPVAHENPNRKRGLPRVLILVVFMAAGAAAGAAIGASIEGS
jgi:hypothetical protein